jgi:hypothetical protein
MVPVIALVGLGLSERGFPVVTALVGLTFVMCTIMPATLNPYDHHTEK